MQRSVLGQPANVRFFFENDLGDLLIATAPPTVDVTDLDAASVSSGEAVEDLTAYKYTFAPPALGVYSAAWNAVVDADSYAGAETLRVVGRRAVPMSRLRTDPLLANLAPADFVSVVGGAEDALENALRYRIVPTVDRVTFRLDRPMRILRPGPNFLRKVVSATLDGSPLDLTTIEIRNDALELPTIRSWDFLTGGWDTNGGAYTSTSSMSWRPGEYVFDLEHGLTEASADIQNAVTILARHYAPSSSLTAYPDRATKIISAETEIWFSRRNGGYFGIPEVDDLVEARGLDLPFAEGLGF